MSDFKKIETQEDFDAAIGERLARERESVKKDYQDYEEIKSKNNEYLLKLQEVENNLTESNKKYAGYDSIIAEKNSIIKRYESDSVKTRIALELGLPYEFASRLTGEDEATIRKDAELLSKFVGSQVTAPIGTVEKDGVQGSDAAYKKLLEDLNKK